MAEEEYEATILWHDMWINGPLVGVCEYKNEKVIYAKNREGKYELRRFKEGGYKKAERHHFAYRASNGGHRDHNPALFTPRKFDESNLKGSVTKTFDYIGNGNLEIITILEEKDFKWFHPPKQHTPYSFKKPEDFNHEDVPGVDIEELSDPDSDEEDA